MLTPPVVCAAIGAGALVYAASAKRATVTTTTCASARRATNDTTARGDDDRNAMELEGAVVSARRAVVTTDLEDELMWGLSEDGKAQFAAQAQKVPLDANSDTVKKARRELAARSVDSRLTRSIGTPVLAAGRAERTTPEPEITGECAVFNMSPVMAQRLYEREQLTTQA